jgi:hypothetical protein
MVPFSRSKKKFLYPASYEDLKRESEFVFSPSSGPDDLIGRFPMIFRLTTPRKPCGLAVAFFMALALPSLTPRKHPHLEL